MKKVYSLIILVILVFSIGFLSACEKGVFSSGTNTIKIKNLAFNPSDITVKVGTTVKWVNEDSVMHRLKSSDVFSSGDLNKGDTFEFKFSEVGTYNYFCEIHPNMKGKVIVEE